MFYWQLARGQKGKQKGLSSTAITPPSTSIFTNQYARTGFIVFRIRLRCCCLFAGFARRNISNHWRRHNGVFDRGCGLCSVQSTGFCERIGHQMRGKYATFGWFRTQGWCTYRNVGRLRTQGWCTHRSVGWKFDPRLSHATFLQTAVQNTQICWLKPHPSETFWLYH